MAADPLGDRYAAAVPSDTASENWHLLADENGNMNLLDMEHDLEEHLNAGGDAAADLRFNPSSDVRIFLFTRRNRDRGQRIQTNNAAQLRDSYFNRAHPSRFIIHGWKGSGEANINRVIRHAYFGRGDFNVFVVDWGAGANDNYLVSRRRVPDVGRQTAMFIDFLVGQTSISFASITVIGHSLGGHAAGFVGKRVTRGRIQDLVALDPANPGFPYDNPAGRVHTSDAVYVESIQTNINMLGIAGPIGHASFYPTFGRIQPGCRPDPRGSCSHERAVEFFVESLQNVRAFFGTRCGGGFANIQSQVCPSSGAGAFMGGEPVRKTARGVFYMAVNDRRPFGRGQR